MSRWKAAGLHLLISIGVGVLTFVLIYFVWYPPPYFDVAGGSQLMLVIMGVDVVIGPFLTLAVFNAAKKWLRFDLTVIALLQIAAFVYGIYAIAISRPVFVVAEVDRYVLVTANQLDDADLAEGKQPEFRTRSWTGPRLVGALPPAHGKETLDMIQSALAGKDIDRFPRYYVPYDQVAESLMKRSRPLDEVMNISPQDGEIVRAFLRRDGKNSAEYVSLPLQGRLEGYTMVVSRASRQPVTALPINPW